jgi:hypothetical protein
MNNCRSYCKAIEFLNSDTQHRTCQNVAAGMGTTTPPPPTRVETKIFVFVFSRKFRENLFLRKSLQNVTKITKIYAKIFAKTFAKTKMYEKSDAGNGKYCEIS